MISSISDPENRSARRLEELVMNGFIVLRKAWLK